MSRVYYLFYIFGKCLVANEEASSIELRKLVAVRNVNTLYTKIELSEKDQKLIKSHFVCPFV